MSSIPAELAPPVLPKRRQTVIGAALAAGSSAMLVVILLGNYLEIRSASDNFFDGVSMPLTQPNVMFWGLGLSVLSMQWVVGAHVAMTIAGRLRLAVMAFRTFAGQFSSRYPDGWSATAVYWHTMVGVFVLVWYAVYITK